MTRVLMIFGVCLALIGCDNIRKDDQAFDGQFFRSKAERVGRDDRRPFTVAVRPASASIKGALEAGRHEATKYCVETFGNSRINWVLGPDAPPESYVLERDTLMLEGVCEG